MKHTLLLLTLLFTAVACSQKGTNVGLKISHTFIMGGAATSSIAGGGLMIWGESSTGESFGRLLQDSDELKLSLKNDSWTFYAMAWDGSKNYQGETNSLKDTPFGGIARCGKSSTVALSGNAVAVDLGVTTSGCADSVFAGTPGISAGELPKFKMQFCSDLTYVTSASDTCTDDLADVTRKSYRAPVGSFKVKMHQFVNGTMTDAPFSSLCVSATEGIDLPNLPAGNAKSPFKMSVEYFLGDSECEPPGNAVRGAQVLNLPNGVGNANAVTKYMASSALHKQFVKLTPEEVCNGRTSTTLGLHPFAAGDGSPLHPFVICSVPQWHAINAYPDSMTKSYKLQADLDFNPFSKGLSSLPLPPQFDCLDLGSNFLPLGYTAATCAGGVMNWDNITSFTGNFSGNGFTIKNLRLRAEKRNHLGLFAYIQGNGTKIGDVNFEKPEIGGLNRVGTLAGEISGVGNSSSLIINKIKISSVDIEARTATGPSDVGGLVGYLQLTTLKQVWMTNSRVRGDSSNTGGVIGYAYQTDLSNISAEVDIEANSPLSKIDIGGVAGRIENSASSWMKHEGGINTNGNQVGGITGSLINTSLRNFYTISSLYTNDGSTAGKLGGVIGWWSANANYELGAGYSLSTVNSPCISACSQGSVVGQISGTGPVTYLSIYHLDPNTSAVPNLSVRSFSTFTNSSVLSTLLDSSEDDWKHVPGVYPRFDFEYHPCSSGISGTGSGTAASPKIICNSDQYLALSSGATNTFHKLMANIRLSSTNTTQFDIPTFSSILDGNGKALIGGHSDYASNTSTSHIGTLTGKISNLRILGMSRNRNTTSGASMPASVFVNDNSGVLENLQIYTYPKFKEYASGFVGHNNTNGQIKYVRYNGRVEGEYSIASLVYKNSGTIADTKVNGELKCGAAACSFMAPVAIQNYGTISRVESSSHLFDDIGRATSNVSMIVDENHGLIQDVVVPKYSHFRINGSAAYYFHRANMSSGQLNRVLHFGRLIFGEFNPGVVMNGFPSVSNSYTNPAPGIHNNVFRGGVSGKELLMEVPFTCSGNNVLNIPTWSGMTAWSSYSSSYNSLTPNDKKFVVMFELSNGVREFQQVISLSGQMFSIPSPSCVTTGGKVSLYQTDDLMVIPGTATPTSDVILPQMGSNVGVYGATWRPLIWDMNDPFDHDTMLDYYAYKLGMSSTPVTKAVWELDDGELRLFED